MKKIKAREAFELGLTRYFTGNKCKNGHISERMISNGLCVECLKKRNYQRVKEWRKNNPGARTEEARRYRERYPEKIKSRQDDWRKRNIEKVREQNKLSQRRLRAINPEKEKIRLANFYRRKEEKRLSIAGRARPKNCEICLKNDFRIVFDHCHFSGKFRGWICDRCNRVLGLMKDDTLLIRELANYLENFYESCKEKIST